MKELLQKELEKIKPNKEELAEINQQTKKILAELKSKAKKAKLNVEIFVGGSSAKDSLIKKRKYDIDIFIRFPTKYSEEKIAQLIKKLVPPSAKKIHGSRDYFSVKRDGLEFEIVPVYKISKPTQAKNITDLSYFHVNYIKKHIKKNSKLADQIRLSKAFAYYQDCYGAESYINGFSGYAIELLLIHYKTFRAFISAMTKIKPGIVIDPARHYKTAKQAYFELNKAKLQSPIILIDPTHRDRNALAALSTETFTKFQKACKKFLAKPSASFFQHKDKVAHLRKKHKKNLIEIPITTSKQAGDIAGTKLKKFHRYFTKQIEKYFTIKASDFVYDENKNIGIVLLSVIPKKQLIIKGPPIKITAAAHAFKKHHKKTITKTGRIHAIEKLNINFPQFLKKFKSTQAKTIKEMSVKFK